MLGGVAKLNGKGVIVLGHQKGRNIQERQVRPLGSTQEDMVDVRVVSATHKDLAADVQAGRFRQDLYYRLNVICIPLPPLRERLDDLPAICHAVLARIAADAGVSPVPTLSAAALQRLAQHAFPGNVRELENLLQRALALSGGDVVELADLGLGDVTNGGPADAAPAAPAPAAAPLPDAPQAPQPEASGLALGVPLPSDLQTHLDAVERDILLRALERHRYNRTAAGASLGLTLRQMRYRMARLGVNVGSDGIGAERD